MKHFARLITLAAMMACALPDAWAEDHIVTIATGSERGAYYPAGGAICRLINRGRKEHGIRCYAESTVGSIYNIHALRDGENDFAVVQSDWQYNAYTGKGVFADGPPFKDLRSVFSLHSEMFTLAVRKGSTIRKFSDLAGKRVNLGDRGSGMRAIMQELMEEKGWTRSAFLNPTEMKPAEAAKALCNGSIDAMVFTAGHPNGLIQEITSDCGARLVPVEGAEIEKLLKDNPYYARTAIPGGMYKGNLQNTPTFGVRATLVTSSEEDEETVYQLTKSVFENFDSFKTLHFVFATLDKERMVYSGLTAPLHPGAIRYYREAGLLNERTEKLGAQ
jgi:TRAP transporter TAXI family solute receptor